jgi:hypothetical protein
MMEGSGESTALLATDSFVALVMTEHEGELRLLVESEGASDLSGVRKRSRVR